jgi:UDP:flavonoid glycosyltransferase YjiC (YdhE family)
MRLRQMLQRSRLCPGKGSESIRIAHLVVGQAPIARKTVTVENLAPAINTAATDSSMRQRASELAAAIRAEDGIRVAVEAIRNYCDRKAAGGA